jgi:hypothetical protein
MLMNGSHPDGSLARFVRKQIASQDFFPSLLVLRSIPRPLHPSAGLISPLSARGRNIDQTNYSSDSKLLIRRHPAAKPMATQAPHIHASSGKPTNQELAISMHDLQRERKRGAHLSFAASTRCIQMRV